MGGKKEQGPKKGAAKKKAPQTPAGEPPATPTPATATGGPGGGIFGGAGGKGGGGDGDGKGGWNWGGAGGAPEGGGGSEKPLWEDFADIMKGIWVVFWNTALFLAVANVLHRSLDWCCSIELLFLVGAPTQAFERIAGRFYNAIEWLEKNLLGWTIPEEGGTLPMYENIKLYYPVEHAYTFDQYRHGNMSPEDKRALANYHALRWCAPRCRCAAAAWFMYAICV